MTKNTHASTLALLETNGDAVVNFIIDNNPAGIQSQMDSIGLLSSSMPNPTRADLKSILNDLVKVGTPEANETFKYILEVEYSNGETNYTGGFQEDLEIGIVERGSVGREVPWMAIINGVVGISNGVFGWLTAQENVEITENLAEQSRYDSMRNTVFGIPKEIVVAMVVVIGVIGVVLIFKTSKK